MAVSGDGSTVVFTSRAALTAEAVPASELPAEEGTGSAYEYRSSVGVGGSIMDGDVYLISDGAAAPRTAALGLDASAGDVFFHTSDSLVPQDSDSQFDVYDARVDGGFPAP